MKAHYFLIACALFTASLTGVLAQDIIAYAGTPFSVHVDAGIFPGTTQARATFAIPALGLTGYESANLAAGGHAAFTHAFTIYQAGTYPLYTTVTVDGNTVYDVRSTIQVLPAQGGAAVTTMTTTPSMPSAPGSNPSIVIPAIPDLTPGTTFVMQVIVNGYGTFDLAMPELPFGTYEAPPQVTVQGETTVPVLVHISENAQPGYYTIPVFVADQTASARIRIIAYREATQWQWFVVAGIILIVLGLILLFALQGRDERPGARPPQRPRGSESKAPTGKDTEGELITYY